MRTVVSIIVLFILSLCPGCAQNAAERTAKMAEFWTPALGDNYMIPLQIAFWGGFLLCELINAPMRSSQCSQTEFKATTWSSFPICLGSPALGGITARFAMIGLGTQNAFAFVGISFVVGAVACVVLTQFVINGARS